VVVLTIPEDTMKKNVLVGFPLVAIVVLFALISATRPEACAGEAANNDADGNSRGPAQLESNNQTNKLDEVVSTP
jgi:hypothetical protein